MKPKWYYFSLLLISFWPGCVGLPSGICLLCFVHRSLLQLLAPLIIAITRVEVTCWEQHWSAAETKWETFAGAGLPSSFCCQPVTGLPSSFCWRWSPLVLPASCPQSKSRSQSHADVQLRLSRSSQVWAKKKLSPAAAFTSGMRRSWELLLPGASAHCGGRHWCDPNRAVCHRPTHGSTDQWLVNHRTQ